MKTLLLAAVLLCAAVAGCAAPVTTTTSMATTAGSTSATIKAPDPCAGQTRAMHADVDSARTLVAIATDQGCLVAQLYDDKSPITVANFKQYVTEGFYTNREFYRIVPGFVNQAGGESQGDTGKHPAIADEATASGLHNYQYTLAMARTNDPHSATTEFYINAANNTAGHPSNLDPGGVSPDGYAVFGILVAGRDVSDKINHLQSAALQSIVVLS